jgi:hypothetical protein
MRGFRIGGGPAASVWWEADVGSRYAGWVIEAYYGAGELRVRLSWD